MHTENKIPLFMLYDSYQDYIRSLFVMKTNNISYISLNISDRVLSVYFSTGHEHCLYLRKNSKIENDIYNFLLPYTNRCGITEFLEILESQERTES